MSTMEELGEIGMEEMLDGVLERVRSFAGGGTFDDDVCLLGMEVVGISPEGLTAKIEAGPQLHQPYGILHGGAWCTIVEAAASYGAGFLVLHRGQRGVVGVSNQTDFLRSHSEGRLDIEARPLHAGRRQHLWQVEIRRGSDAALVARGQVRFHVLDELPAERSGNSDASPGD